ncbi:hypothetical protein DFA_07586 [Cavenderia fasciculata]|uniref:Defective in cullin neddylation protein n=1 Tax=Cavenderia fasciculata TaxID=261658 RepID=F4Q622_CACFS|nr:uncharacterized protein DFA_07586 [Cavenderia fasciculata]EGG16608.1 hypothetical protein DFA_07586 [Cavenderia fasciculata]|eukprot:XP_004355082.1 hypothetical protein DFA_07586 [Cavenderia fasciculata]
MVRKGSNTTTTTTAKSAPATKQAESVRKKRKNDEDKVQPHIKKSSSPFTSLQMMFEKYKDEDNLMGPDAICKFCFDLGLAPESIQVLVLAWQMNADKMGYFQKEEFVVGLEKLKSYDLVTLKKELIQLTAQVLGDPNKFLELYKFSFGYSSELVNKKLLDVNTAAELLELVLPQSVHTPNFVSFLRSDKHNLKVINKDHWLCYNEFSKTVKRDLSNYDQQDAWPLLFDTFVEFVQEQDR